MLADTTFLIDFQREVRGARSGGALDFLRRQPGLTLSISLISWMEFAEGFANDEETLCRGFLADFLMIAPTPEIAWRAARLARELRRAGVTIEDNDLWIAATAVECGLPLVSRNTRHFGRIRGLDLVRY